MPVFFKGLNMTPERAFLIDYVNQHFQDTCPNIVMKHLLAGFFHTAIKPNWSPHQADMAILLVQQQFPLCFFCLSSFDVGLGNQKNNHC
jgi:hypothetical protein